MYKAFAILSLVTCATLSLEAKPQNARVRSSFPVSLHKAASIFKSERTVVLEDGSQWTTCSSDALSLATWRPGDALSILPNYAWFTDFTYTLVNENNQSRVQAHLEEGPSLFNPACCWITNIEENHIFLQNGMTFCISLKDAPAFKYWAVNDPVILGTEDSAWTHYPLILINCNTSDFVRAVQY